MWPAADEKRKNSLQMIHLLKLIVIEACLVCIIFSGGISDGKRLMKRENRPFLFLIEK